MIKTLYQKIKIFLMGDFQMSMPEEEEACPYQVLQKQAHESHHQFQKSLTLYACTIALEMENAILVNSNSK